MQPLKLQRLPLKSALPPTVPSNLPPRHQPSKPATKPQSFNTEPYPPLRLATRTAESGGCSGLKGILIVLSFGGLAMLCIYAVLSNVAVSNALEEFNKAKNTWTVTQTWHVTATAAETVVATVLPTDVKMEVDGMRRLRSNGRQGRRPQVMVSDM